MKRAVWVSILLASGGCVDLKSAYPEKRYYVLEASRSAAARTAPKGSVLRVRRFTSSRTSEGTEFVARTGESEFESDFYNVFFSPPAGQATEQAQRWLSASGLFAAVVGTGASVPESHVLEGNLAALYEDRRGGKRRAVLELQVLVVRVSSDPAAVILQKNYREEQPLASEDPAARVKGWSRGLEAALAALEEDLAALDRNPVK